MSADMMVICKEDNSDFNGDYEKAFFIDETSVGEPLTEFGRWFADRFCGSPGIADQLMGIKEHRYTQLTKINKELIIKAMEEMETHNGLNKDEFVQFIESHIGKHISTENW